MWEWCFSSQAKIAWRRVRMEFTFHVAILMSDILYDRVWVFFLPHPGIINNNSFRHVFSLTNRSAILYNQISLWILVYTLRLVLEYRRCFMGWLERVFETFLWKSRYIVVTAVISSLVSAFILFFMATGDVFTLVVKSVRYAVGSSSDHGPEDYEAFHNEVVSHVIGAVDDYLLATVLLIFALGLYELFISKIDQAEEDTQYSSRILLIKNLDDLKDRLAKVILMILIVTFFKNVVHTSFEQPLNIFYLGGGILLVALALFFTYKSSMPEGK